MKYFLIVLTVSFLFFGENVSVANAAQTCYQMSASTRETGLSTQQKLGQQYIHESSGPLVSVSMNIYGNPTNTGSFRFSIHETSGGLPTAVEVAGSVVTIASNTVPDGAVGVEQAFICDSIPVLQTFTFASPVALTTGVMYAFTVYQTTTFQDAQVGWVQEFENVAPLAGLICTGAGCTTDTGWALTDFLGFNYDMIYSVDDLFVDLPNTDGKIDGQIANFREWSKLDDSTGGLIFTVIVMLVIFVFGMKRKIPFLILGGVNALLIGAFTLADITPPWILLTSIGMVGVAIIAKLAGLGSRGESNEV